MPGPYGTQAPPRPGQPVLGYGPSGQVYNMQNPVVQTMGGFVPYNATTGLHGGPAPVSAATQQRQQNYKPPAWTAAGRMQAAQPQQPTNPLLAMLGGGGNIQTSITPQNIYSPQQTQEAVNQSIASSSMPLPWLQNRFAGRGASVNSPAVIDRAMVPYAQGLAQGQIASAQIPLQDITANAQHWTAGEQAREGEALDWARLLTSAQGINQNARLNTLQSVLGLLGAFM